MGGSLLSRALLYATVSDAVQRSHKDSLLCDSRERETLAATSYN